MSTKRTVKLSTIVDAYHLKKVHISSDYKTRVLETADVNRPALQLTGFYDYFDPHRLQMIGRVESTYLDSLSPEARRSSFAQLMKFDISALVLCHGVQPSAECLEMAEKYDVYYRVHSQTFGWLDWAKNGEPAGTEGYAKRLEGIQIVVLPKGSDAPTGTFGFFNPSYIKK